MDILELRRYCLSLPLAEECTPFDETTLVFKIGAKCSVTPIWWNSDGSL